MFLFTILIFVLLSTPLLVVYGIVKQSSFEKRVEKFMQAFDDKIEALRQAVENERTVQRSAISLIQNIPTMIKDASARAVQAGASNEQLVAIDELAAAITNSATDLAAAVTANTPSTVPVVAQPAQQAPNNPAAATPTVIPNNPQGISMVPPPVTTTPPSEPVPAQPSTTDLSQPVVEAPPGSAPATPTPAPGPTTPVEPGSDVPVKDGTPSQAPPEQPVTNQPAPSQADQAPTP